MVMLMCFPFQRKNKIAISVFMAGYRRHNGEVVFFYHIYLFKRIDC